MNLIAGDIGGTKSWLALLANDGDGELQLRFERRYQSNDFNSATALLSRFISDAHVADTPIERAVLALPGPINAGQCRLTNLDWVVDQQEEQSRLAIPEVTLVNDFQASSAGIATLDEQALVRLNQARSTPQGVRVITGAGTGLGLSWMQWHNGAYHSYATEGGHIDFAPTNRQQSELLQYLYREHEYVPYERLLCGRGLETLHQFVTSRDTPQLQGSHQRSDAATVTQLAAQGDDAAVAAVELFIAIYGAWVGNLALLYRPSGGLYIAGGMAAKMASWMQSDNFIAACYNKGRMSELVRQTPIYLVTNERLGLQGAIAIAVGKIRSKEKR